MSRTGPCIRWGEARHRRRTSSILLTVNRQQPRALQQLQTVLAQADTWIDLGIPEDADRKTTITFEAPARAAAGKRSVLVVDDDEALARAVSRLLTVAGYDVKTAADGSAALEAIKRQPFDVILSDIHMPAMSGVELLRIVRSYDLDVPVLLMTGAPSVDTAIEAISLGVLQYLPKPTPREVLLDAVERASRLHRLATMKREAFALRGATDTEAGDRAGLEARFARALEHMWIAFQPLVDPAKRRIVGYEALLRSREPSLPDPGAVLEAAEKLDRLHDVGRRVRSLAAMAFVRAPGDALLFVNVHTRDLLDETLYRTDGPLVDVAHRVVLEITERTAVDSIKDAPERVARLRSLGFQIAIDDLGAGYAGLSSFALLEPEVVKLDMSLVRDVHKSQIRRRLVESMTASAKRWACASWPRASRRPTSSCACEGAAASSRRATCSRSRGLPSRRPISPERYAPYWTALMRAPPNVPL